MTANATQLIAALLALVLLTFVVGALWVGFFLSLSTASGS